MIKADDNVMVGGLPTDIVIPCDSIDFFNRITIIYQFYFLQCYGPNWSWKKHCMLLVI